MVQMTHARTFNPKTGEWGEITAKAYKQKKDHFRTLEAAGEMECHCPDPRCTGVRVSHHDSHLQMFYGDRGSYQLNVPSHFQRWPGATPHHPDCEIVQQYGAYQNTMRDLGALSLGNESYIVNLNVPTQHTEGPVRRPLAPLKKEFRAAAPAIADQSSRDKRPLSYGIKDLKAMGLLIEQAAYNEKFRRNVLFRRANEVLNLDQLYQETPRHLFKVAQEAMKTGRDIIGALTVFQPAALQKFWQMKGKGPGRILGQPEVVKGRDHQNHHVAMTLHVENRDLYHTLKQTFNEGYKSFLVYSDKIYIDPDEIRARNEAQRSGQDNKAFVVHVHVTRPEQITPWTAPPPQKPMDFLGKPLFDLREQPRWNRRRPAAASPSPEQP